MAWANMHELSSMYYGIYNVICQCQCQSKIFNVDRIAELNTKSTIIIIIIIIMQRLLCFIGFCGL